MGREEVNRQKKENRKKDYQFLLKNNKVLFNICFNGNHNEFSLNINIVSQAFYYVFTTL